MVPLNVLITARKRDPSLREWEVGSSNSFQRLVSSSLFSPPLLLQDRLALVLSKECARKYSHYASHAASAASRHDFPLDCPSLLCADHFRLGSKQRK
jgi:hypothetical protein